MGATSEAQKTQTFFWKKNLKFLNVFSFEKCRIVPKNVKGGTLLDLLTYILAKYQKKTRRGDPLGTLTNFRKKSRTVPKKIQRGDLL